MANLYRRNGCKTWWIRFQSKGVRVQRSSGTTRRSEALQFLAKAMEEERQRQGQDRRQVTFRQLCDEYRTQHLVILKSRTRLNYVGHLQAFGDHFGDKLLDEIRKLHIADFVAQKRREGLKSATIRRYLATLSSLFSFAERRGWLDKNPLVHFDRRSLPEAAPRTRFLSPEEYRRLLAAAADHLRPLLELAVTTGIRLEELLSLKWEQVDLDRRELRLVVTKSKRPRVVPLSDRAVAAVVAAGQDHGDAYVFTNPDTGNRYRNVRKAFQTACKRAGIVDFRWHDLRHTFASWAVQAGTDLYPLSRLLGHSTLQMSARYGHLATKQLHQAVQAVATSMATGASDDGVDRATNSDSGPEQRRS